MCQSARLVRADDCSASESFDRRHIAYNGVALGQSLNTYGEHYGRYCRKAFRYGCRSQTHGGHEHGQQFVAIYHTHYEYYDAGRKRSPSEGFSELVQADLERGLEVRHGLNHRSYLTDFGIGSGADHDSSSVPVGYGAALKGHVRSVTKTCLSFYYGRVFLHRKRLSRKGCLLNFQIGRFYQADIGGNRVSGLYFNHVSRNQCARFYDLQFPIPEDLAVRRGHFLQRIKRFLGLGFLDNPYHGIQDDYGQYDYGVSETFSVDAPDHARDDSGQY